MPTTAQADSTSGKVVPADGLVGSRVYALGALGFDFGSIQRRDVFFAANGGRPIITNADLSTYLSTSPVPTADFEGIIWTLVLDGAPVFALRNSAHHGLNEWGMMQIILAALGDPTVDRLAVPGVVKGEVTLLDGRVVPTIDPDVRGILTWSSQAVGLAVGLTGSMALAPTSVNLTTEGALDWADWSLTATPGTPVRKTGTPEILGVTPIGVGGTGLLTSYTNSSVTMTWTNGTAPVPTIPPTTFPQPGSTIGVNASAASGGLQLTAPADTTARVLRIYLRTFGSTGQIIASFNDGSVAPYVDTSFNAFPSIAGMPGVVDGVYTITYRAAAATTLTVQFVGTQETATSPNLQTVSLYEDSPSSFSLPENTQSLGIGAWVGSTLSQSAVVNNLSSAFIPAGLRVTIYEGDNFTSNATVLTATPQGSLVTLVPAAFDNKTQSLIIEQNNYVGVQAATLANATLSSSGAIVPDAVVMDFMDRVYYLLRNAGVSSQERAINFAATQIAPVPGAFPQAPTNQLLANALAAGQSLETIAAEASLGCRPGSDCWDVTFTFFDPRQIVQAPRTYLRLTVDVSNVRPVMVTPAREWTAY